MRTHSEKTQENTNLSASLENSNNNTGSPTFQYVDNRPEAVTQRKLQEMANNSPQVMQMKAFQDMVNNSPHVKQLQAMAYNNSTQEPIQKQASPELGGRKNNTGLPDNLKAGVENLSGYSMDDVKVHYNSDKPAQLQAHAYAQGTDIHLGAGQEKHLPHEAWHVVQQKQGRVKPTMQMKNKVNINDDARLEKEADMMGKQSVSYGFKSKIIPNKKPKQDLMSPTIQRFYAVQNEDNVREYPKEEKGTIDHYNLGYIWIPRKRDEDDYKYEIETPWFFRKLYSREQIILIPPEVDDGEYTQNYTEQFQANTITTNYPFKNNTHRTNDNTKLEGYMRFAQKAPVPTSLADQQSRKVRAKVEKFTLNEPIQEGLKSMVIDRLKAVSEMPQDPEYLEETLLWGDYFLNANGYDDLKEALDIASDKLSLDEKGEFLRCIDEYQLATLTKTATALTAGLAVGKLLNWIPNPVAKVSAKLFQVTGVVQFYNKIGEAGQSLEKLKRSYPKSFKVAEEHRNKKLGSRKEAQYKRFDKRYNPDNIINNGFSS